MTDTPSLREQFLEAMLESSIDYAIIALDLQGRVTAWNKGAELILGWTEAEMLGRPAADLFTPEDRALGVPDGEMRAALTQGRGGEAGWRVRKDGSRIWAAGELMPLKDKAGAVAGFIKILRDRTEVYAAEQKLALSEERLALALAASGMVGTWDWDLRRQIVFADPNFARLYTVDPEHAAQGAPIADYTRNFHPDDVAAYDAALKRKMEQGEEFRCEYRILQPDGSVRRVIARGKLVRDAEGVPARFPGATVDVTELRAAEETLRLTQDAGGVGTFEVYREAGTVEGSAQFFRLFGLEPQAGPVPADGLFGLILEEDLPRVMDGGTMMVGGGLTVSEYRVRRANDGEVRWLTRRGQDVVEGGITRSLGVIMDITERKQAEEALRASEAQFRGLAVAIPNQVWTATPDGLLDWLNPGGHEYAGAGPEALYGEAWAGWLHPDDAESTAADWIKALTTGERYETEFRLRNRHGEYRWQLSRAEPIRGDDGTIIRWIGSNTDIEDQKTAARVMADLNLELEARVEARTGELMAAEEALRQAQKMEAVGQLTGGIAHDFNNLLQVIQGNLQLVTKDIVGNAKAERRVENAQMAVTRGAKLASQLLAFGRRQALEPKVINVGRFVSGMDDMLRRMLGGAIDIETSVSGGLWNTLADPGQIENAVLNLAINARDAMEGTGRLTIEVGNAFLDDAYALANPDVTVGQYVLLAVTDTGSGMTPAVMARVFEPFFSTKPEGQGTGLGLSMVYGFVKQSGGHVKIYSEVGEGTTIKLYLPRADAAEDVVARTEAEPATGGRETILVAEDDDGVRGTVVEMLGDLGYRVLTARDAASALSIIESGLHIDLLFTDVVMPGALKSPELARIARERLPGIRVLFTSGYTRNAIVHGGRLDAGVELLAKPYTREGLARKVRAVLG